jgi:putative colanic acid biosynthesis UDP-glucose lipid carrier transferase
MHQQLKYYLKTILIGLDALMLNLIFAITLFVFKQHADFSYTDIYLRYLIEVNLIWWLLSYFVGLYSYIIIEKFETFTKRTMQTFVLWLVLLLLSIVLIRDASISRLFIVFSISNFGLTLFMNRFLYFAFKNHIIIHRKLVNKVIILGYNETAKKLAKYFEEDDLQTQIVGFVEDAGNVDELTHYPVLTGREDLIQIASNLNVQEIYSTITPEQNKSIYHLMNAAEHKCMRFKIVPNLSIFLNKPVLVDYIRDMPILTLRKDPLEDIGNRIKKRLVDVIVSSFAILFILSWLVPLLGMMIKLESKGPIFFKQKRTGRGDQPFSCLKFRSMCANHQQEEKQATLHDFRVTKVGAFIRKTSLDEFPQFLNVLIGNMSLVGPRPHMIKHTSDFAKLVDHYMARQLLKPGITGWAQVHSFRGEITNPEQLQMRIASDLWYLENWTIWLDIKIIFLTVYQVFRGDRNAY